MFVFPKYHLRRPLFPGRNFFCMSQIISVLCYWVVHLFVIQPAPPPSAICFKMAAELVAFGCCCICCQCFLKNCILFQTHLWAISRRCKGIWISVLIVMSRSGWNPQIMSGATTLGSATCGTSDHGSGTLRSCLCCYILVDIFGTDTTRGWSASLCLNWVSSTRSHQQVSPFLSETMESDKSFGCC
jgi:hypothetical protein